MNFKYIFRDSYINALTRIKTLEDLGRFKEAKEECRAAVLRFPDDSYLHSRLALLFLRGPDGNGLDMSAKEDFLNGYREAKMGVELNPEGDDEKMIYSLFLFKSRHFEESLSAVEDVIAGDPENLAYQLTKVNMLKELRKWKEAEKILRALLAIHPDDPAILTELAEVCLESSFFVSRRRVKEAETYVTAALAQDPTSINALRLNIRLLEKRGAPPEEIRRCCLAVLRTDPTDLKVQARLSAMDKLIDDQLKEREKKGSPVNWAFRILYIVLFLFALLNVLSFAIRHSRPKEPEAGQKIERSVSEQPRPPIQSQPKD